MSTQNILDKEETLEQKFQPLSVRLLRFSIAICVLVGVVFFARYPIQIIPAFNEYSQVVDRTGFHPGALYYSDVPITMEAEKFVRSAVKEGMVEWRKNN